MKFETKIATLLMCTTLALLSSCNKKLPDTPVQEQQVPVGFRAMSQAAFVKSDPSPLSAYHANFGVWGIARHEGITSPYILWNANNLTEVVKSATDPNVYVPVTGAYWISGYEYSFLAVAPFNSGASDININTTSGEVLTFNYNIANKYDLRGTEGLQSKDHLEFDLMAAAAKTEKITAVKPTTQGLTFWHLFTRLAINVTFTGWGNDASGNPLTGTVTGMRLCNVDSEGTYTISYDESKDNNLSVNCVPNGNTQQKTISFNGGTATIHLLPQNIGDFEMYIDFIVGNVTYTDFKLNLNINSTANPNGTNSGEYKYNENYAWNITIGPKEDISFKVEVLPWTSEKVNDNDIEIL